MEHNVALPQSQFRQLDKPQEDLETALLPIKGILRPILIALLTAAGYYAGIKLGFALTPSHEPISGFWPPNAILLAALLLAPYRMWWVLILAVLPLHLLVQAQNGVPLPTALGWFIGNVSEALLGAACMRYFHKGKTWFESVRGVVVFLVFGVVVAPLMTSFLDAAVVVKTGWGSQYWALWAKRLSSNMLAELTVVPTIVVLSLRGLAWIRKATLARYAEASLLAIGLLLVSVLVFGGIGPSRNNIPALVCAPLPFLLWAAIRFGPGGLSSSLLAISLISIWNAVHDLGPFTSETMPANVLSMKIFLSLITVPNMLLAAVLADQRHTVNSLREMGSKLLNAQEAERHRLARELHDDVGQQVALLGVAIDQLRSDSGPALMERWKQLSDQVCQISRTIHDLSHGLHPTQLEHLGLAASLRSLCREIGKQKGLKISFKEQPLRESVPPDVAISLYRVAQEALNNMAKHSHAENAAVELRQVRGRLVLRILDDGVGFDPQQASAGLGLVTMRERLNPVGGTIDITSSPTTGTAIEAWVPLADTSTGEVSGTA
ncbi:MAG TPA: MASE1 domain-containing protein [Candidatus Sulfotelmatobacter sp.]|jgi:signal transduction histidine kinase|nr:MASE1 domain-containing protein [Candidatus Sulfotelmatobacter sp.]